MWWKGSEQFLPSMSSKRRNLSRSFGLGAATAAALLLVPVFHPSHEVSRPSFRNEQYDIARRNIGCAEGLFVSKEVKVEVILSILDQWAAHVKTETERYIYRFRRNPAEYENSEGYFRVLMMAVVLHEDFGVRYNPAKIGVPGEASTSDGFFADPSDVFLHGLLGPKRMGTCSSMPVLYLALGRRLGYPLKLVTTKGHLFVRWEGLGDRFNIEVTGRGVNLYEDEHYRHWPFELADQEIAENGYLKSLTPDDELAVFLTIRAECLKEAKRYGDAVTTYTQAVRLAPHVRAYRLLLADTERIARESGAAAPQESAVNSPSRGQAHIAGTQQRNAPQRILQTSK